VRVRPIGQRTLARFELSSTLPPTANQFSPQMKLIISRFATAPRFVTLAPLPKVKSTTGRNNRNDSGLNLKALTHA
jgi:hypothetical protein